MPTDSDATSSLADPADTPSPAPADNQAPASSGENPASTPDAPVSDRDALLKVVRDVVKVEPKTPLAGEGDTAAPEPASPGTDPAATQAAADALEADPTDTELAGLVPRTRQRIEKLLGQRNAARTEIEALKPRSAKWDQMEGYLTRHDLAAEDVNLLLGVGAALRRGDFKAFRDGVMPYVELANQALGLSLPPDIQTKVDTGELSAEAAKELATTRFTNARLQGQAQARTETDAATRAAEGEARISQEVQGAVTAWEAATKGRDPDYAKKAPAVLRITQALMLQYGRPRTAEAAVAMAKSAYEEAGRMFAAARPAAPPTLPQPSGARAVNGARAEPRSLREAVMRGLERGRG